MALAVPLSRFTSRVGGGSAFFVRRLDHIMQHPIIQKYISELVRARYPYFTSETEVICGRVVLTASPSIDSEVVHLFRLDMPADTQPNEMPYCLLFFVSVWGLEVAARLMSESHDVEHDEVIGDWRLRAFIDDGHPVFSASAMTTP